MPRVKKTFDREEMYKKIMPSASRSEKEEVVNAFGAETEKQIEEINQARQMDDATTLFSNKEIKWVNDGTGEPVLYNLTERMVINRLDVALKKMECCRCDRCKKDIVAFALNTLSPHYVVCTKEEMENIINSDTKHGLEITSAILKAILKVRKQPRH